MSLTLTELHGSFSVFDLIHRDDADELVVQLDKQPYLIRIRNEVSFFFMNVLELASIYYLHYVPNYYANHVFQDISKNILAKQIKLLQQLRFTMISLW